MNAYIEKIVVTNFKSYGIMELEIPIGPGFVGIVGPNGAGKSNIGDAISFGLGLSSSKTMRAKNLTHLIHTNKGQRQDFAKVDIYFANPDVFGYDILVVSRIIYKDGKSVYRLNNTIIREKDLHFILAKGGIYKEGYNIVLQGDIVRFVKITPIERRKVIEDVAGISEYEHKKDIALQELGEAEIKIRELKPLIEELEQNLERLSKEKERLDIYRKLTERKYNLECILLLKEKESILRSYRELEQKRILLEEESLNISSDVELKTSELKALEQEIQELNNMLLPFKESSGKLSARIQYTLEQIDQNEKELEKEQNHQEDTNKKISFLEKDLSNLEKELIEIENIRLSKAQEIFNIEKEINVLEDELLKIESSLNLSQDEINQIESKEKELKSNIENLKKELQKHIDTIQDIAQKENKYKEDIENLKNDLELLSKDEDIAKKQEHYEDIIKQEQTSKEALSKTLEKHQKKLQDIKVRKEEIMIQKANIESQMRFSDDDIRFDNIKGVYGKVEDLIYLKSEEYKEAIEAAAGARLSYVIVENEDVAKTCIELLKKESKSRMSFIPLSRVKTQNLPSYPRQRGYIDFAIKLIEYDKNIEPAIHFVFGDSLIVEDFDVAKSLQNYRCITLEGEVFEKTGVISGGKSKQKSHIGKKMLMEKLQHLNQEYETLKKEEEQSESTISNIKSAMLEKDGLIAINTKYLKDLEKTKQELTDKRQNILQRIKSGSEYLELLKAKKQEHLTALEPIKQELNYLEQKLQNLEIRKKDILNYYTNPEIQKLRTNIEKLKKLHLEKTKELSNLDLSINSAQKNLEHIKSVISQKQEELNEVILNIDNIKSQIQNLKKDKEQLEEELQMSNARFYELYNQRESLGKSHKELQASIGAFMIKHEKLLEELGLITSEITKLQTKIDMIEESLREKNYQEGSIEIPFIGMSKLKEELERTRKQLEDYTDINFKAEEDYIETKERLESYKEKLEQLNKDKQAIKSMIEELDRKKYTAFMEAFTHIKNNFKRIYASVSYQGKADLILENQENPFEGGVGILVKPRGKDVQYIEAISGGEQTLAAMSLIFAIQEYKPSVFYYFDEIDAHLDEANAYLLGQMIKEKSQNTQFIVVTLRENLAAFANRLIGVTSKDNISKVLTFNSLKEVS